ncbi:MAG TPA: DNA-binding protein [Micrococcus luteus]|nr:DNA-binding protein [Micrococcus luteus]
MPAAAERLGIGRSLAYALVQRDEFPVRVLRLGTRRLVSRVELERYLAGEVEPRDAA